MIRWDSPSADPPRSPSSGAPAPRADLERQDRAPGYLEHGFSDMTILRRWAIPMVSGALGLLWSLPAGAQSPRPPLPDASAPGGVEEAAAGPSPAPGGSREADLEQEVRQLKDMVRQLSARVEELSARTPAGAPSSSSAGAEAAAGAGSGTRARAGEPGTASPRGG